VGGGSYRSLGTARGASKRNRGSGSRIGRPININDHAVTTEARLLTLDLVGTLVCAISGATSRDRSPSSSGREVADEMIPPRVSFDRGVGSRTHS
jgi:hypothetical protein